MDTVSYLLGKKAGGGGTPPTYQDKEITISTNGTQTITADTGYNALSSVEITTSVPQPSGKITITQNGTDIDVSSYASADVNVPAGADLNDYFNSTVLSSSSSYPKCLDLIKKFPSITIDGTSAANLFSTAKIKEIPTITNISSITNFEQCFSYCTNLTEADFSNISFSSTLAINFKGMFSNCTNLTKIDLSSINTTGSVNLQSAFTLCPNLKEIDLSNLNSSTRLWNTFQGCTSLEKIDISNLDLTTNVSAFTSPFTNVPTNCLILVKDQASKEWLEARLTDFTNIQVKGA